MDDLLENFLSPRRFLRGVVRSGRIPFGLWSIYVGIALLGTGLFGYSFGLVFTESGTPWGWAWVITGAAAAGWAVFLPAMVLLSGGIRRSTGAIHACLVTMVYGEAILEVGTILNLLGYWRDSLAPDHALTANAALVVVSNGAMALAICAQMRVLEVAVWKTLSLWFAALNGVGALVFWTLYRGVLGG